MKSPIENDKEVSHVHNTATAASPRKCLDIKEFESVTTSSPEGNVQGDTAPREPTGYSIQEIIQQVSYIIHACTYIYCSHHLLQTVQCDSIHIITLKQIYTSMQWPILLPEFHLICTCISSSCDTTIYYYIDNGRSLHVNTSTHVTSY